MKELPIAITQGGIFAAAGAIVMCFGLVSVMLLYHWKKYGGGDSRVRLMRNVYLIGGAALSAAMFLAAAAWKP